MSAIDPGMVEMGDLLEALLHDPQGRFSLSHEDGELRVARIVLPHEAQQVELMAQWRDSISNYLQDRRAVELSIVGNHNPR